MKRFIPAIILVLSSHMLFANMKSSEHLNSVIFFTHTGSPGQNVIIRGKVISVSASEELPESELSGIAIDKTKVTVKI